MLTLLKQNRTGFYVAMIGLMLLSAISPVLALANSDLVPGDDAVVTNATNLYSDASYDASIQAEVATGTPVSIQDGPITGSDGSLWYAVEVWDIAGYIPANDLDRPGSGETEAESSDSTDDNASPEVAVSVIPWQEPIDFGVADDNVKCRDAATTEGNEITTIFAGQTLEITGLETWVEGVSWTPVNCGGQGGFVATDFITTGNDETEDATTEATEVATEEATADETEAAEATEETRGWLPPIDTLFTIDNVICRAAPSTTAQELTTIDSGAIVEITGDVAWGDGLSWLPVNCAGQGGFVATDFLAEDLAPTETATEVVTEEATEATEEVVETETATAVETEVPTKVATEIETPDVPSADDIIEDVNSQVPSAEEIIEDVNEQVPSAEEIIEDVNEQVPSADEIIEDVLDDVTPTETATDEATATETATEEATATEDATLTPTEEPTEEGTPTDEVTETPTATEDATEEATPTGEATETATSTEDVTETPTATSTEDATETATEDATGTPEATETATQTDDSLTEAIDQELVNGVALPETESTSPVTDDEILGTAEVRGTDGKGIACRTAPNADAPIIRTLPEGMNVLVLSQPDESGWMSILCDNQVGYAHSMYLYSGGAMSIEDFGNSLYAYVSGTGGGGLNCRSQASITSSVVGWLPEGSAVNIRGANQGEWVPIVCGGQNAWVHSDYLSAGMKSGSSNSGNNGGGGNSTGSTSGTATVVNTDGDGLRCRTSPNGPVIMVASEGTKLPIRGAAENGWLPVVCGGQNGYAHTDYLSVSGGSGNNGSGNGNGNTNGGASGGNVTVTGTGGSSLNCRTGAGTSYPVITAVREGTVLKTRGAASNGWQPVVCGGQNGWVSTEFVTSGGQLGATPSPSPTPTPNPGQQSAFSNGDHARTTSNLNLRYEPSSGAGIATYAPEGTVVLITGGHAGNGYYPVNWDGLKGFMHGDYLTKTDEALSKRGGSGNPTTPTNPGGSGSTATGNAIVDYAMGYLGYPYVWATHGPSSFDCSGFTYWVIKNVVGKDIGTGLWTQVSAGQAVSRNSLQPGDLVFFQNTYKAGLSHVGIYIGDNQFIHAQNEATGVVISDLNSNYYGSRWYGAVRIT